MTGLDVTTYRAAAGDATTVQGIDHRDHQRHPLDRCEEMEAALIAATEQLEEAMDLLERWAACAAVWSRQTHAPPWLRLRIDETKRYLGRKEGT